MKYTNMKTITKVYNVYKLEELPKEAQEKALEEHRKYTEYYGLSYLLTERLQELLKDNKIVDTNDTSKAGTKPTNVLYSLSYCQGDGAMFEGDFVYTYNGKEYTITIKHSGIYYHSNSKNIYVRDMEGEDVDEWEDVEKSLNDVYISICKQLEREGYDFMEYEDSMESFSESCEANEYTFTIDGIMDNQ
jgi:hypothetical protein